MNRFFKKYGAIILVGIGIIIAYVLLTQVFDVLSDFLFPDLLDVFALIPEYWPKLFENLWASMQLLVVAYVLAVVAGVGLGTLIGLKARLRFVVNPYIIAFSAIPVPLMTPYAINIFPTFKVASIFLIWLAAFWVILATTIGAVESIDRRYLENAATLEMPKTQRLFRVVLPAASPGIFTGCSVALTLSFMMLAVSEMFGATAGLAHFVHYYSDFARFDLVMLGFLFTALCLILIMCGFNYVKNRSLRWTINN